MQAAPFHFTLGKLRSFALFHFHAFNVETNFDMVYNTEEGSDEDWKTENI